MPSKYCIIICEYADFIHFGRRAAAIHFGRCAAAIHFRRRAGGCNLGGAQPRHEEAAAKQEKARCDR